MQRSVLHASLFIFGLVAMLLACVGDDPIAAQPPTPQEDGGSSGSNPDGQTPAKTALAIDRKARVVPQSSTVTVGLTVTRVGVEGPLNVRAKDLPQGVTAPEIVIDAGVTTGTFAFSADTTAGIGSQTTTTLELFDGATKLAEASLTLTVSGKPGTLDTTWGSAGVVRLSTPSVGGAVGGPTGKNTFGYAVAVYPATSPHAGKVIIAGKTVSAAGPQMFVSRLDANGALDTTYGSGGKGFKVLPFNPINPNLSEPVRVVRVAIDAQDRVVLLGNRSTDALDCVVDLLRLTAIGEVDVDYQVFGGRMQIQGCGDATDLAISAGDGPVVLGSWNYFDLGPTYRRPIIKAFNANGTESATHVINVDGYTTAQMFRMRIDALGRYVLAGNVCPTGVVHPDDTLVCKTAAMRVATNGAIDKAFGTAQGITLFDYPGVSSPGNWQAFYGMAMTSDTIIGVGGNNGLSLTAYARMNADGALTQTFGNGGKLTRQLVSGSTREVLYESVLDEEGRMLAVGYVAKGNDLELVVTRMDAKGAFDPTFGDQSVATVPGITVVYGPRAALALDGRLLVISSLAGAQGSDLAIWRFWP